MPHFPKPFFKKARGLWYLEINRKQINLGPDEEAAFRQYHHLMGQPREQAVSPESLVAIIDAFLEWTNKNRSADTYEWYRYRLQRFVNKYPEMRVSALKPFHVEQWVDDYDIAQTTRRNYCVHVAGCLQGRFDLEVSVGPSRRFELRHFEDISFLRDEVGEGEQRGFQIFSLAVVQGNQKPLFDGHDVLRWWFFQVEFHQSQTLFDQFLLRFVCLEFNLLFFRPQ